MNRRRSALALAVSVITIAATAVVVVATPASSTPSYPTTNPAAVCGSASLNGPATAPAGATVVPAGPNSNLTAPNTVYYFESGVHTLGDDPYSQIEPGEGSTFIGAPGAVLDGQGKNRYAFTQQAKNVTIKHLTITGFKAPHDEGVVNHDSGDGWVVEHNTIHTNDGAALMAGKDNVIRGNCLRDNGQYGLNAYKAGGLSNLVLQGNEITGNNTGNWEVVNPGCGCSGGAKFWAVNKADVTGNWVHHNHGVGLWADTNNNDFVISGNLLEGNAEEALIYEISYNLVLKDNAIKSNAWTTGQRRVSQTNSFPVGAIYLSEADGEPRIPARTAKIEVTGNLFENNWGGVVAWANADRFCNSPANTSSGICTLVQPTVANCSAPGINTDPLYTDCRWWTKNVEVHANEFKIDPAAVAGGCDPAYCGHSAVLSNWGTYPDWSPYKADVIQKHISFSANNRWHDNAYTGPWSFQGRDADNKLTVGDWRAAPYNQDAGSTFDTGGPGTTTPTSPTTSPTTSEPTSTTPTSTTPTEPPGDPKKNIAGNGFEMGPDQPWYGARIEAAYGGAKVGTGSLRMVTTEAWGSAVQTDNWPGYAGIVAGRQYAASLWYKESAATMPTVTWTIRWTDDAGTQLRADEVPLPRSIEWKRAAKVLTAPAGATHVRWSYTWSAPAAGPSFQIDQESVKLR